MTVYVASYELRTPGKDYKSLYVFLQQFVHCHHQTSTWFLDTTSTAEQIREGAKKHIDANDIFFVGQLSGRWASWNSECAGWLNDATRNW
jgi:hypothetical protein